MLKRSRLPLVAVSIFATSSLLLGCSDKDRSATEPGAANSAVSVPAATLSVVAAPVAYTPEPFVGAITTCNIEAFDKAPFQSRPMDATLSTQHSISGWIATPQLANPRFWLRLDDKSQGRFFQVRVEPTTKRPDVVTANNLSLPLESGFTMKLPVKVVPAGQYHLYLVARADGRTRICDSGRQVNFN